MGRRSNAAFTLVELVVVLLVMGILAGVATPRFGQALVQTEIDAAARRLAADLRYARSEALRTSVPQAVEFLTTANSYSLPGVADPDHPSEEYAIDLPADAYGTEILDADFAGSGVVTFGVHGFPSSAGSVTLVLGGEQVVVACDDRGDVTYGSAE